MDKVFDIMDDIYSIYQESKKSLSINQPSWRESYGKLYKYCLNNILQVELDFKAKKLMLHYRELGVTEEFILDYPRFTTRGSRDKDPNFFNFYFSVRHKDSQGVLIIKAANITNFQDLYDSKYRVDMETRQDYLSSEEIVDLQEFIYRGLGLGNGLEDLEFSKEELEELNITRGEARFVLDSLRLGAEENYLASRLRCLELDLDWELINRENFKDLGLESRDYKYLEELRELRTQVKNRRSRLETGRSRFQVSLDEILEHINRAIVFEEQACFTTRKNVVQVLRDHNLEIKDIDMCGLTNKLVYRISQTSLGIVEMLDLIFNYKRGLAQAYRIDLGA